MRLADELLDGRGSKVGREPARGVKHGVDGPLGEKRAAVGLEQPCRLGGLGGGERPQRLLRLVTALEPLRGGDPHLAHLGSARGEPREGELAHRRAERVPAWLAALELDEEAAARQGTQRLVGSFDPERVAELGREALERRHPRRSCSVCICARDSIWKTPTVSAAQIIRKTSGMSSGSRSRSTQTAQSTLMSRSASSMDESMRRPAGRA